MKRKLLITISCIIAACTAQAQIIFTDLPTGTGTDLKGIAFADTSVGFACGDTGVIIKTTNGGTTWSRLNTGTIKHLWDIKVIPGGAGQQVLAIGDDGTILKTTNGGSTWAPQTSSLSTPSFLFGIHCVDANTYYVCGGEIATTPVGVVLKTTDGGTTWVKTQVPAAFFFDKITMAGTALYGVGMAPGGNGGVILKNTSSWVLSKAAPAVATHIWPVNANTLISVTTGGHVYKTTDAGATWTDKATNLNGSELYGIKFKDANEGYVCGMNGANCVIAKTTNGGDSWVDVPYTFSGTFNAVEIIGNKLFISGGHGKLIKANLGSSTAINAVNNTTQLIAYPSPATDKLYIKGKTGDFNYSIYNSTGTKVLQGILSSSDSYINIIPLLPGTYYATFNIDNIVESISFSKR